MNLLLMTLLVMSISSWSATALAGDAAASIDHKTPQYGIIDPALLATGYSGKEDLLYDVSWTGGIKIGELRLQVNALPGSEDEYEIRATVTTKNAAINLVYPVKDLHVTKVRGPKRLPYHYEIWQQEGYKYRVKDKFVYKTGIRGYTIITHYITLDVDGLLTIDGGYSWDGASGPALDTITIIRGSLVHDALYQLIAEGLLPFSLRKEIDNVLIRICKEDGMWVGRRWWVLLAVNTFGARALEGRNPVLFAPEK